jgi:hypothetical protein
VERAIVLTDFPDKIRGKKKVQQQTSWILHLVYFLIAAVNFEIHDFKYWRAD